MMQGIRREVIGIDISLEFPLQGRQSRSDQNKRSDRFHNSR